MRHYRAIGDPQLSSDGQRVLVRVTDATADGAKSHLWLIEVKDGQARQLTYSPASDKRGERAGQWMPDGQSVLFLAKRGEHTQLFRLPMGGGEAKPYDLKVIPPVDASKLPEALPPAKSDDAADKDDAAKKAAAKPEPVAIDVSSYRIAPDGKTIAIFAADPQTPGEKKQKDAKADATWVDHDLHGDRMYLLDVATEKLTPVALPIDVQGASWSADSAKLVAVVEGPNGVGELGPASSAWVVKADDPAHPTKIAAVPVTVGPTVWSQDGQSLVFMAQARRDAPPGYEDVFGLSLQTIATHDWTDGYKGSVGRGEPVALADGSVVFAVEDGVDSGLMLAAANGTMQRVSLPTAAISGFATNAARSAWAIVDDGAGHSPQLLYTASLSSQPRVLWAPALAPKDVRSVVPQRLSWKSEGLTIEGLLYLPPEAAQHKVPLVVEVHGGPLGSYLDSFSPFSDFLLAQGWAVLRTNPRGSTGRGAAFAAANKNDLGGGDYRDIMAGVDYALAHAPIDADKLALMGYSYGGEMAGFVETKTTRFKAIVSAAPVIDQNSEYGTEKGSWYDQWYFGKPWEHEADAWRQSPLSGAAHAKTPLLLLQGEEDTTDPLGQSLEMYHALRQMGVPVDLVTYPRVDHGPLGGAIYGSPSPEPWHGFDARQRVVAFFQKAFGETK